MTRTDVDRNNALNNRSVEEVLGLDGSLRAAQKFFLPGNIYGLTSEDLQKSSLFFVVNYFL
jgi:hypothetical protein